MLKRYGVTVGLVARLKLILENQTSMSSWVIMANGVRSSRAAAHVKHAVGLIQHQARDLGTGAVVGVRAAGSGWPVKRHHLPENDPSTGQRSTTPVVYL